MRPAVPVGGRWGGVYGRTWWFHGDVALPDDWAGEAVVLLVRLGDYATLPGEIRMAGPEGLAYLDGVPFAGVDYWHGDLLLTPRARGDERHALALEVYAGRTTVQHPLRQYELATRDADAAELAADLRAASEALAILDPEGADAALLTRALDAALALVDFRRPRSAA